MLFSAGGIATPADAALMMQLGAEAVFVGSGIFKSGDPAQRAEAIVRATTHYDDPDVVAKVSRGLGEAMVGINLDKLPADQHSRAGLVCPASGPAGVWPVRGEAMAGIDLAPSARAGQGLRAGNGLAVSPSGFWPCRGISRATRRLRDLGAGVREVRTPAQLEATGLVIPAGSRRPCGAGRRDGSPGRCGG